MAPVRNYFLREENYTDIKRAPGDQMFILVQRFGELIRKLWNPRHFKAHVSPHEMLQAVVRCSRKKFQITEQGLPVYLSVCLSVFVCPSRHMSVLMRCYRLLYAAAERSSRSLNKVSLSICLSLSLCLSAHLSVCVCISVCLSLSIPLSVPPSV